MRFDILASVIAVALFLGYFLPLMLKLKNIPLGIVLLGGIVLVLVDVWQSLSEK